MHVKFEGKTEAAWSFFFFFQEKQKVNFLFRGGPQTVEKGREEGGREGGAHSHIGCATNSRALCGTP